MKSKCEYFHKSLLGLNEGWAIRLLPVKWIAKNTIHLIVKFTQYKVQKPLEGYCQNANVWYEWKRVGS